MKHASFAHQIAFMSLALLIGSFALADELIPATSEDLAQFDQQLAKQVPAQNSAAQNFGKKVSAEAQKLNSQDSTQMKKFGSWVRSQHQQDDQAARAGAGGVDRDGGTTASGMPTNGSAVPGNSGRHGSGEDQGNGRGNNKH